MTSPTDRSLDGGLDQVSLPPQSRGSLWLCGKRVTAPDPEAVLERAHNAAAIVCFNEAVDLAGEYPEYLDWLRHHEADRAVWLPLPDFAARSLATARTWIGAMVERLGRGDGLILHCGAGIGRAPTMATCVLIALGMSAEDATRMVAGSRPTAGPETAVQRALVAHFGHSCLNRFIG